MKKIYALFIWVICCFVLTACATNSATKPLTVGLISAEELLSEHMSFSLPYQNTHLTKQEIIQVKEWPATIRIDAYFGSWCHDSQREVPVLLKLLTQNPTIAMKLIALDYQKSDPQGLAQAEQIKFTPTFIIYNNDREIGRIIERPKASLVEDISAMVNI